MANNEFITAILTIAHTAKCTDSTLFVILFVIFVIVLVILIMLVLLRK
jgi:hypothetical protein